VENVLLIISFRNEQCVSNMPVLVDMNTLMMMRDEHGFIEGREAKIISNSVNIVYNQSSVGSRARNLESVVGAIVTDPS
jgi:hypothetical protein